MKMEVHERQYKQRKGLLREFHRKAKAALSPKERSYLYGSLKEYQAYRQVDTLMEYLLVILDTPTKLDLLRDVRLLLPVAHITRFDALAPYHQMANPPPGYKQQVVPAMAVNGPTTAEEVEPSYATFPRAQEKNTDQHHFLTVPRKSHSHNHVAKKLVRSHSASAMRIHSNKTPVNQRRNIAAAGASGVTSIPVVTPKSHRKEPAGVPVMLLNGAADGVEDAAAEGVTLLMLKDAGRPLGFSVRGGSEHGLGIYVSEIDPDSIAEASGLKVGDHVTEVNSVSFDNIASSSAVKVLTGSRRLRVTVRRVGRVPSYKFAREKTSWFDTSSGHIVLGDLEDQGTFHFPTGLAFVDSIERRIHMLVGRADQYLGFNIRGGSEYGLAIYVSRVDAGGLAEQKGLKVGDQIVAVNGTSFENITHSNAVDILRSNATLIVTVKDVGKYPAFKEIFAEYSWIDCGTGCVTQSRSGEISSVQVNTPRPSLDVGRIARQFPVETRVDAHAQTDTEETDDEATLPPLAPRHDLFLDTGVQTDDEDYEVREALQGDSYHIEQESTSSSSTNRSSKMLLPRSRDLVLVEKPTQTKSKTDTETKSKDTSIWSLRKKDKPRSTIGVMALQHEAHPNQVANGSTKTLQRTSSLVEPNGNDPRRRAVDSSGKKTQKSRTFREKLFGTKPRDKGNSTQTKKKNRQTVSSVNFSYSKMEDPEAMLYEGQIDQTVFAHGVGSQLMLHETMNHPSSLGMIENTAKKLLRNEDEVKAIMRHINSYEEQRKVARFVPPLLAILDTPEKMTLLREIRGIVYPGDIGKFDGLVSQHELKAYAELTHKQQKTDENEASKTRDDIRLNKRTRSASDTVGQDVKPREGERFVELRRRRHSLGTDVDLDTSQEVVIPADPDSNFVATIHRHRSNSKIYIAKVDEKGTTGGEVLTEEDESQIIPAPRQFDGSDPGSVLSASSTSSIGSSGVIGVYSVARPADGGAGMESIREDVTDESGVVLLSSTPLHTPTTSVHDLPNAATRNGKGINATDDDKFQRTSGSGRELDSDPEDQDLSALISAQDSTFNDSSLAPLPLDSQFPAESTSAASSPRSARHGSYDVNPAQWATSPTAAPRAVFTPPPPPDCPPPTYPDATHQLYRPQETGKVLYTHPQSDIDEMLSDSEEDDGWREWLALDTDNSNAILPTETRSHGTVSTLRESLSLLRPTTSATSTSHHWGDNTTSSVNNNNAALGVGKQADREEESIHYVMESPSRSMTSARSSPVVRLVPSGRSTPNSHQDSAARSPGRASPGTRASSNRTHPIGFPSGGFASTSRRHFVHSDSQEDEDESDVRFNEEFLMQNLQRKGDVYEEEHEREDVILLVLGKDRKSLGMSISGGVDSATQPEIRIQTIYPGGAAAEDGTLLPGMRLLSIDGRSLDDCTHQQAVDVIRRAYTNKRIPVMKIVAVPTAHAFQASQL